MNRPWQIWITAGICLAIGFGAVVWTSVTILRLDRSASEARAQAQVEESVRLALWRMDSLMAGFLAKENARPYADYTSFFQTERAYTKLYTEIRKGEVLVPSPLLVELPEHVRLHFQFSAAGILSSPQAPTGNMRDLAESKYVKHARIEHAAALLQRFSGLAPDPFDACRAALASPENGKTVIATSVQDTNVQGEKWQQLRNIVESQKRATYNIEQLAPANDFYLKVAEVKAGIMKPIWIGDELVYARRVTQGTEQFIQGCWLDWPGIQKWLLGEIRDLFASAHLQPVQHDANDPDTLVLASLPVRLAPGAPVTQLEEGSSPVWLSLLIACCCLSVATGAVLLLLFGVVTLSERRGAFVSAVTHELRTPLTTFRMYSEMLAAGMVKDEETRKQYLNTLCVEADRLSHLVENVLSYSRIEGGGTRGHIESVRLADIVERIHERLSARAEQSQMKVEVASSADSVSVSTDTSAVEQILFNLVDNACKYASGATDKTIHIECKGNGTHGMVRVSDHGPGIDSSEARRMFRPFSKSAKEAAHSAAGVGLGLALSRRLARTLGGDLTLEPPDGAGAAFVLTLPLAEG